MKQKEKSLQKIRDFADKAHGEQMRKYTAERYIVHPERVMQRCKEYTDKLSVLAAALLHDVLEDTDTTAQEILSYLNEVMSMEEAQLTLQLVEELTDVYEKKHYPDWNRKKRKEMESKRLGGISVDAQSVKYADIFDNAREIMEHDRGFGLKFSYECKMALDKMTRGHPELRKQAYEAIRKNLRK